jgi:predicted RNA binding protein YcfA (HicA-like mRNA interferase family)
MSTVKLKNISLAEWRRYLKSLGLNKHRTKGGHEMWGKTGLTRQITFSNHIEPIPEMVIRSNLRTLGVTREQFCEWLYSQSN